jgi:hypothetical protein
MVKLGDYLSTLFNEITKARVEADMVALNVAREYTQGPNKELLKHFPIPRVRVRSIDVTMPVVIDGIDEKSLEEYRKPIDPAVVEKVVNDAIVATLKKNELKIPAAVSQPSEPVAASRKRISLKTISPVLKERLKVETYSRLDTRKLADAHADDVIKLLQGEKVSLRGLRVENLKKEISDEVESQLSKLKPPPPKLDVQVATSKVRESAGKENVTYLTFTIYEDAFESGTIEDAEGNEKQILTPE